MSRFHRATRAVLVCLVLLATGSGAAAQPSRGAAGTPWWNRSYAFRSKYYAVKTDLPREEALALARHMDVVFTTYLRLFRDFGVRSPKTQSLFLFSQYDDYTRTLAERFGIDASGSAGLHASRGSTSGVFVPKMDLRETTGTLQHECFHLAASIYFPDLPIWANEGMAEMFERGVVIDGRFVLGEVSLSDKKRLVAAASSGDFLSFRQLFALSDNAWLAMVADPNASAGLNYLQSWCLCHFFLYADDSKYQRSFLQFLAYLNQDVPDEQAFVRAFGVPRFENLEKSWLEYVAALPATDYRETIYRMEFLARGMAELRSRGVHPATMDDLKAALCEIDFRYTSTKFGATRSLHAMQDDFYKVPVIRPKGQGSPPVFRLVDARGNPVDPDDASARRSTVPMTLQTLGYAPKEFRVTWKRIGGKLQPAFEVE